MPVQHYYDVKKVQKPLRSQVQHNQDAKYKIVTPPSTHSDVNIMELTHMQCKLMIGNFFANKYNVKWHYLDTNILYASFFLSLLDTLGRTHHKNYKERMMQCKFDAKHDAPFCVMFFVALTPIFPIKIQ